MGNTRWRSNLQGKNGTETISNFASVAAAAFTATGAIQGATVEGTTSVTGVTVTGSTSVIATSYITVGTNKHIMFGDKAYSASIVAEATALLATPSPGWAIKGSLYVGAGDLWVFKTNTTASKVELI